MARKAAADTDAKVIQNMREVREQYNALALNIMVSRADLFRRLTDPRRDIYKECGYPKVLTLDDYGDMYDRDGLAGRVVSFWPDETWKVDPEIKEGEERRLSSFERSFKDLQETLQLYSFCYRADELSGIGHYGLLLLGFSDGQDLSKPVRPGNGTEKPSRPGLKLNFLRPFEERQVRISKWDTDLKSPRYGMPITYSINFAELDAEQSAPKPVTTSVHWTRVLHIADRCKGSEVNGTPRQKGSFNYLMNVQKILGASPEMFWKGGYGGIAFQTQPELINSDVEIDKAAFRKQMDAFQNGLQKNLYLEHMTANPMSPTISDPTPHLEQQFRMIAVTEQVPMRIMLGSEQALAASEQDRGNVAARTVRRQYNHAFPRILKPLIERLIWTGVIEPPETGKFKSEWPNTNPPTDTEQSAAAMSETSAMATYVSSGVESLVPPFHYLTNVLGWSDEEAEAVIAEAEKLAKSREDALTLDLEGVPNANGPKPPDPNDNPEEGDSGPPGAQGPAAKGPPGKKPPVGNERLTTNAWSPEARAAALLARRRKGFKKDDDERKFRRPAAPDPMPIPKAAPAGKADAKGRFQVIAEYGQAPAISKHPADMITLEPGQDMTHDKLRSALKAFTGSENLHDIPALAGALPGSVVTATVVKLMGGRQGLDIETVHREYTSHRILKKDRAGNLFIENALLEMNDPAKMGSSTIGAKVFSDQVVAARRLGVKYLATDAAGMGNGARDRKKAGEFVGYYAWPLCGYQYQLRDKWLDDSHFDEENYPGAREEALKLFGNEARSISSVVSTAKGRDWWYKYGSGLSDMKFDLADNSTSMKLFRAYMAGKGK